MKNRIWQLSLVLGSMVVLSGCSVTAAGAPAAPISDSHPQPSASVEAVDIPSEAARMICSQETQGAVASVLGLDAPAELEASLVDGLYTCSYHAPIGELVLSVQVSPNGASARNYFDAQAEAGPSAPIEGLANLGLPAFETPDGTAVFVKDNMTLAVDATALPEEIGPDSVTRNAVAYQIATTVLACWTGGH